MNPWERIIKREKLITVDLLKDLCWNCRVVKDYSSYHHHESQVIPLLIYENFLLLWMAEKGNIVFLCALFYYDLSFINDEQYCKQLNICFCGDMYNVYITNVYSCYINIFLNLCFSNSYSITLHTLSIFYSYIEIISIMEMNFSWGNFFLFSTLTCLHVDTSFVRCVNLSE